MSAALRGPTGARDSEKLIENIGEDVQTLLKDVDLIGVDNAGRWNSEAQQLSGRLAKLEADNIQAILQSEHAVQEVLGGLDVAAEQLDELDIWLDLYNSQLTHMRQNIEQIEETNNRMEIQSRNHKRLHDELGGLIAKLDPPAFDAHLLVNGDLHDKAQRERIMVSASAIKDILTAITTGDLSAMADMKAVQEQLSIYLQYQAKFAERLVSVFQTMFGKLSDQLMADRKRFSRRGEIKLQGHAVIHGALLPFAPCMDWLRDVDLKYHTTRKSYVKTMMGVYHQELHVFFAELRHLVIKEPRSSHVQAISNLGSKKEEAGNMSSASTGPAFPRMSEDLRARSSIQLSDVRGRSDSQSDNRSDSASMRSDSVSSLAPPERDIMNRVASPEERAAYEHSKIEKVGPAAFFIPDRPTRVEKMKMGKAFSFAVAWLLPTIMAEQEFLREFFSYYGGAVDPASGDLADVTQSKELEQTMSELYSSVRSELNSLIDWALQRDQINIMPMLVKTEQMMTEYQDKSGFISSTLTELQIKLRTVLNKVIDEQIQSIDECKIAAKRCGILPCFWKFPLLVDHIDSLVDGQTSAALEQAYQKLAKKMFTWLEKLAAQDTKYTNVVRLENCHHFFQQMSSRNVPCLQTYITHAQQDYERCSDAYVHWIIRCQFKPLIEFFEGINGLLKRVSAEEVHFEKSHTKQALRSLVHGYSKGFDKSLVAMYKRVDKHLCEEENLLPVVWARLVDVFVDQYEGYEEVVTVCYGASEQLNPLSSNLRALFRNAVNFHRAKHQRHHLATPTPSGGDSTPRSDVTQ